MSQSASPTIDKIDQKILENVNRLLQTWPAHPSDSEIAERDILIDQILNVYGADSHPCHQKAYNLVFALHLSQKYQTCFLKSEVEGFPINDNTSTDQLIGQDSFARVYKATYNGRQVAVRVLSNQAVKKPYESLESFFKKLQMWQGIPLHPNVLQFHGCYLTVNFEEQDIDLVLISPHPIKDLANFDAYRKPYQIISGLILGIAKGLKHLHEITPDAVIHGDLCPENVLLEQNDKGYVAKLAGFGTAKYNLTNSTLTIEDFVKDMKYERVGPELARNPGASRTLQTDIFAMGTLIYESFTGELPEFGPPNVLKPPDRHPHLRNTALDAVWALIQVCWSEDPNNRPSARDIVDTMVTICENIPEETSVQAFRRFRTNDT